MASEAVSLKRSWLPMTQQQKAREYEIKSTLDKLSPQAGAKTCSYIAEQWVSGPTDRSGTLRGEQSEDRAGQKRYYVYIEGKDEGIYADGMT